MGFISREDFLARQAAKSAAGSKKFDGPKTNYFKLEKNGDEAVVRFMESSDRDLQIFAVHKVTKRLEDGTEKFMGTFNCERDFREPVDKCPLCANGVKVTQRVYIRLIEYTRNDDGTITATPKIWERPVSFVNTLTSYMAEYGDISNQVFKVKRINGARPVDTTYTVIPANSSVYNETLYKKDMDAFKDFEVIGTVVRKYEDTDSTDEVVAEAPAPRRVQY